MSVPSPNPFEPPNSDIGSGHGPRCRRKRMLLIALSVQWIFGVLGFVATLADTFGTDRFPLAPLFVFVPPALALWGFQRGKAFALPVSLLSGVLLQGVIGGGSAARLPVLLFALAIVALTVSLMWSEGMFRMVRAR